jgi:hypothetical protein
MRATAATQALVREINKSDSSIPSRNADVEGRGVDCLGLEDLVPQHRAGVADPLHGWSAVHIHSKSLSARQERLKAWT